MLNNFIKYFIVLLSVYSVQAQTESWKLTWDANPDSDNVNIYKIFRGTSPSPAVQVGSANHPQTVYEDLQIQRGILYYYRLKAVNYSSMESEYSAEVSAAVPKITNFPQQMTLPPDTAVYINLNNYAADPDHADNQLVWAVSGNSQIQVTINASTSSVEITTPSNWSSEETLAFTCTDPDGFSDAANLLLSPAGTSQNQAPSILSLPQASISQDETIEFNVSAWAADVDDDVNDLIWTFDNYSHLTLDFNDQTRILKITSSNDGWSGFEYIKVTVHDDEGASDSDTLLVRVTHEISSPQINNFPDISFNEDEAVSIDLNDYVSDSDSPSENLFWRTNGNVSVRVTINQITKEAEFSALDDWFGPEQFWMVVTDPDQQQDSVLITVDVQPVNDPPILSDLPPVDLSGQSQENIDLKIYVTDVDDNAGNLEWEYSGNTNVNVNITQAGIAGFSTADNWYGQETIQLTVKDASDAEDSGFIVIYRQDQQQAPSLSNLGSVQMTEDASSFFDFSSYISDPDNTVDELSWTFSESQNIQLNFDKQNLRLTLNPAANWNGSEEISVRVEDPAQNFDLETLLVEVEAVNDIPQISQIPNITLYGSTFYTIDLKNYIIEPDGLDDLTEIDVYGSNPGYIGHFLDTQNFQLTFFSPAEYSGQETYFLRISDSENTPNPAIFTVEVRRNNIEDNVTMDYFGGQTNVRFAWETVNYTKDYIEYGLDNSYGNKSDIEESLTTSHQHILQNLQQNATYHFRIVSLDENQKANYSQDSVFTTGESEDKINVFPIPWRAENTDNSDGIFFTNLQPGYKIMIYNLAGEPVYNDESLGYTYKWNVNNKSGKHVSSGLYLYIIKSNKNKKLASGKIIVIR